MLVLPRLRAPIALPLHSLQVEIVCAIPTGLPNRYREIEEVHRRLFFQTTQFDGRRDTLSGEFARESIDAAEAIEFANSSTRVSTGPHQCVCQSYAVPSVTKLALPSARVTIMT